MTFLHQGITLSAVSFMSGFWGVQSIDHNSQMCFVSRLLHRQGNSRSVGTIWSILSWTRLSTGKPSAAQHAPPSLSRSPERITGDRQTKNAGHSTLSSLRGSPTGAVFERNDRVRIAIVGGGIAGITAASAIATRLQHDRQDEEIVVFEADSAADTAYSPAHQPQWTAATARNANSVVPGAAMHIMSQRSILVQIAQDSASEWAMSKYEQIRDRWMGKGRDDDVPLRRIDDFTVPPPYFAFHVLQCLGVQASPEERRTFLTFLRHFVITSLLTGPKEAVTRGKHIVQLAKANREALLRGLDSGDRLALGVGHGLLSLHRSLKKAEQAVEEAEHFGEEAKLLSWNEAVELEPHLRNLPFGPVYAVQRDKDVTANCLSYVHQLKRRCEKCLGVEFRGEQGGIVTSIERVKNRSGGARAYGLITRVTATEEELSLVNAYPARFRIITADGLHYEADFVVLAAGISTPIFAQKLEAGRFCPTYPLRGYSLTVQTDTEKVERHNARSKSTPNLLHRAMSVDQLYCTSVGSETTRLAGFGELVGYREAASRVPSVGPRVLARYGRAIFPEAKDLSSEDATPCFRPLSPDDIPLAGKVSSVPGLFIHNGHGTLGWTLSLATADCVAQALCEDIKRIDNGKVFELPDKTLIDRSVLSPDRFR